MNQDMLNEMIKRVMFEVLAKGELTIEVDEADDDLCPECDYVSCLEDEIDELLSENNELKAELAERTIDDLFEENEFLHDELSRIKYEHNCTIDMIIELLQDEKL